MPGNAHDARADVWLLSPFHTGSHQAWAEGLIRHGRLRYRLHSLSGSYWKWRMHGAAVSLARQVENEDAPAAVLATDMCDLATFAALVRPRLDGVPLVLYMHENQLTYPLPEDPTTGPMRRQLGERDRHYAWINYTSMLAADRILFNSEHHRRELFGALPGFLRHYPDHRELDLIERLEAKSDVLPVGLDLSPWKTPAATPPARIARMRSEPAGGRPAPLIVWNQRWEYDKAPEELFRALLALRERGCMFRVAVCGENRRQAAAEFTAARERLGDAVEHWGYASHERYVELLREAEVTASTALHEFFGIGVVECMAAAVFPVLPERLNYPDLVPVDLHDRCLYRDFDGLVGRLAWALAHRTEAADLARRLAGLAQRYDWTVLAPLYDRTVAELAGMEDPP